MLKRLTLLVFAAFVAWSGYWAWGAQDLRGEFEGWFEARRDAGWQAAHSDMSVRGFPNRHDITWSDLHIADPESGLGWRAPFFQVFLLSYNRHHAIAVWPNAQVIETRGGDLTLNSQRLRASVITGGGDHALDRANLVADVLNVETTDSGTIALAQLRAAVALNENRNATYDVGITIDGLALPPAMVLAAGDALPETFQETRLQAQIAFDAPWSLTGPATPRPVLQRLDISRASIRWGPMSLRLTGALTLDGRGQMTGDAHLQARNWQDMLRMARAGGQVPDVALDTLEAALALIAQLSGSTATLDVSLRLDAGHIYLGPIPIGRAPRWSFN